MSFVCHKEFIAYSLKVGSKLCEACGILNRSEYRFCVVNSARELNGCFAHVVAAFDVDCNGNKNRMNSKGVI